MTKQMHPFMRFWNSADAPYIAPMAVFLLLTYVGGSWPGLFVASYIAKTLAAGALLIHFRRRYQKIQWNFWAVGIALGIVGIVQWCGVEELLLKYWPNYPRIPGGAGEMNPFKQFATGWQAWSFIIIRWAGATLVVPFMEELFWRDYLWRNLIAPNDFRLAKVGEWEWPAAIITLVAFVSVHPQWITALIWGALITGLLLRTRSLGACILMHAVTNFLLGVYTLMYGKWYYW
jgi:uncharacterized protein